MSAGMINDFPSFYFASHRSSSSIGVGRTSASALIPTTDDIVRIVSRRLRDFDELTVNWKALSPAVPLGKPNIALAFPRPRLEDFTGKTDANVKSCDVMYSISDLSSHHNHPEIYLTSEQCSDLVAPVMVAQRECLLHGREEILGNCLAGISGRECSDCVGLLLHPNGKDMSSLNVSLCTECHGFATSESSGSSLSVSGHDDDDDSDGNCGSQSHSKEDETLAVFQKLNFVTHQKFEMGWEIHQINCVETRNERTIGVRTDYGCCFFKGPSSEQVRHAHETYMADFEDIEQHGDCFPVDSSLVEPFGALQCKSRLMHVSISPHIVGEAVVSTALGGLHLWSSQSGLQAIRTFDPVVVGYEENWSHCCFAAHPRQIWMATRNRVEKIDCRTSKSSLQLLSSDAERIKNVTVLEPQLQQQFCVLFATEKYLALVDERFPSEALLLWEHGLQQAPHFMQVHTVCEGDSVTGHHHAILLGSSSPADAVILTYRDGVGLSVDIDGSLAVLNGNQTVRLPAQGVGLAFPVAKYKDWPGEMKPPLLNSTVHRRVATPLYGIQMIGQGTRGTSGLRTVLQLSDQGDLFYEQLEYSVKSSDSSKHFSRCDVSVCWQDQHKGDVEEWILEVEQQEKDQADRKYVEDVEKFGFGAINYIYSRPADRKERDLSHVYSYAKMSTDLCYGCWEEVEGRRNQTETTHSSTIEIAEQGSGERTQATSCRACGFMFGQPCAIIRRGATRLQLMCAPTDKQLCNSFSGTERTSSDIQNRMLKRTPKHSANSGLLPDDARKMEFNRFGCVDSTKVAALSLVSKPDEKHSAFSHKLWEDWFEGEEPSFQVNCYESESMVAVQQLENEQPPKVLCQTKEGSPTKAKKRKRKHTAGF